MLFHLEAAKDDLMRLEIVAQLVLDIDEADVSAWLRKENALLNQANNLVRSRMQGAILVGGETPVASLPVEVGTVTWRADFAMRVLTTFAESAAEVDLAVLGEEAADMNDSVLDVRRRK